MSIFKKIREWIFGPDDYYEHIEPMTSDEQVMTELFGSPVASNVATMPAPEVKKPRNRTADQKAPAKKPSKKATSCPKKPIKKLNRKSKQK